MKYHISSSLFVLFCIVLCACNSSSVEKDGIIQPAFNLIERQIGERATGIQLEEIAPENGKETFERQQLGGYLLCVPYLFTRGLLGDENMERGTYGVA